MHKDFVEEMKEKLLQIKKDLWETTALEKQEFDQLFSDVSRKDSVDLANELLDQRARGMEGIIDRDLLWRVSSALHRIENGNYGYCAVCGKEINRDRLKIKPEALMCIECRRKNE